MGMFRASLLSALTALVIVIPFAAAAMARGLLMLA